MRLRSPLEVLRERFLILFRSARVFVWFSIGAVLVLAVIALRINHYVQADPSFCSNCHIMTNAWDTWATSSHRDVPCRSCHNQTRFQSLEQLYKYTIGHRTRVSKHGFVPDVNCRRCHFSGSRRWVQVGRTAGHQVHVGKARIECVQCHAGSVHRFEPPPNACRWCHPSVFVKIRGMGTLHCLSCHEYLIESPYLKPSRGSCLACHSRMGVRAVSFGGNAPMQFPCGTCHEPHKPQDPRDACIRCHPNSITPTTPEAHKQCIGCHTPHSWRFKNVQQCRACHASVSLAVEEHRIPGHVEKFCIGCHQEHGWKFADRKVCSDCHAKMKAVPHPVPWVQGHQEEGRTKPALCANCHEKSFCANCHSRMQPESHKQVGWAQKVHGVYGLRESMRCATCHSRAYCMDCHGLQMPHPAGWIRAHSTAGKNRTLCAKCHSKSYCDRCHGGPNMMPPDHVNNWRVRHGKVAKPGAARCMTCHVQRQCDACHGVAMPHPAGWLPDGHGRQASFKRGSVCFRCHQESYCYRLCHQRSSR